MIARRHHYIPQFYLNLFSSENENKKRELFAFDAVSQKCFKTSAAKVALERDFNTMDIEGHSPDVFERAMASIEGDICPAINRIVKEESLVIESDRVLLLNFIGLLYIRNPRFRAVRRSSRDRVSKMIIDVMLSRREIWDSQVKKAKEAGFIPRDADAGYEKCKLQYNPNYYKIEIKNEEYIGDEIELFDRVLPLLFARKWTLLRSRERYHDFITCDHPVCLTWSEPRGMRLPLGLGTRGTEILFPISPKLAAVGAFEIENCECDLSGEMVASANGTIILNAYRQVYAGRDDFQYQIDQKKPPRNASDLLIDNSFIRSDLRA